MGITPAQKKCSPKSNLTFLLWSLIIMHQFKLYKRYIYYQFNPMLISGKNCTIPKFITLNEYCVTEYILQIFFSYNTNQNSSHFHNNVDDYMYSNTLLFLFHQYHKKSTKYYPIEACCLTISIYIYLNTKGHRKYAYDIKYHVQKVNNEVTFIDCKFEWT